MKLYIFVVLSAIFGVALSASGPECDISSDTATKIDIKSSEEFWKNVDGANKITQLTSKSQQKFLKDNPNAFVMYYTTRCPNSQNAKVGFAAASKDVSNVAFGSIDCDKDPWGCQIKDHPFRRVPQHFLYKDGEWKDEFKYTSSGKWTKDAFVSFLKKQVNYYNN